MVLLVLLIIVTIIQYIILIVDICMNYDEPQYSFIESKLEFWLWFIPILMIIVAFIKKVKIMINNLN